MMFMGKNSWNISPLASNTRVSCRFFFPFWDSWPIQVIKHFFGEKNEIFDGIYFTNLPHVVAILFGIHIYILLLLLLL
jgi:hypothetical protein